jgi:hypothetical protein
MLCPVDCAACREALCRAEGACKLNGEPMLDACHYCGEILAGFSRTLICVSCVDDAPVPRRTAPRLR